MAKRTRHPEVKQALEGLSEGYTKLGKLYRKFIANPNLETLLELSGSASDLAKSLLELQELCAP